MVLLSASVLPRLPEGVGATQSRAGSTKSAIDGGTIGRYRERQVACAVLHRDHLDLHSDETQSWF